MQLTFRALGSSTRTSYGKSRQIWFCFFQRVPFLKNLICMNEISTCLIIPTQATPAGISVPFQTQWRIRDWWPSESQVAVHLTFSTKQQIRVKEKENCKINKREIFLPNIIIMQTQQFLKLTKEIIFSKLSSHTQLLLSYYYSLFVSHHSFINAHKKRKNSWKSDEN